jgi:UDP-N-acetylglucosamine 2-epimerase (non-hydrolysing)
MKIISVVGARPNFMKIAPFVKAVFSHNIHSKNKIIHLLVHTGQHYDDRMSGTFFEQLEIPEADINLGVGSGSHSEQVGKTMIEFEKVLKAEKPDWVIVVGDVNATLACSVTAKKENIKCCHIEAGLRSGDISMPEEINRLVTDRISDLLLTPDIIASQNLRQEGIPDYRIQFVGNIMIDTLETNRTKASKLDVSDILKKNMINNSILFPKNKLFNDFVVLTLHRPSNVDKKEVLEPIVDFVINEVCKDRLLFWTLHPRTRKTLEAFKLFNNVLYHNNIILLEPLSYLEMLKMNMEARIILTDSGGLQEECNVLGTPCVTLRPNTERPVTLKEHGGVSVLAGNNIENIRKEFYLSLQEQRLPRHIDLWDGHTAERCLKAILDFKS